MGRYAKIMPIEMSELGDVAAGAKETATGVGFAGYTTMQEITKAKCSSTSIPVGTEGRLKDTRDGKIYWVAKLKDGLCWMTQNLDYIGYGIAATNFTEGDISMNKPKYYDPGNYVYMLGSETSSCSPDTSVGLSGCVNNGWISVDELQSSWISTDEEYFVSSTNYVGVDGQSICSKKAGSMFGDKEFAQCRIYYYAAEHYAAGKYYNWMAATNGTGSSATSDGVNASGNICPTGWSLPLSDTSNNSNNGSFYKLVNGLTYTQITVAPYYFVYGGYVSNSTLNNAGSYGYYWSATASSSSYAYYLGFLSSSVNPSAVNARYYGYSVRCVAR